MTTKKQATPKAITIAALQRFAFLALRQAGVSDIDALHALNQLPRIRSTVADEALEELRKVMGKEAE